MSAAVAAAAAAAAANRRKSAATTTTFKTRSYTTNYYLSFPVPTPPQHSLYETKKRQDLNTFAEYLRNQYYHCGQPSVSLRQCNGSHVVGFLKYLDQFGETKVHNNTCKYYGQAHPPAACGCPLKQASSSLDAVVSRVRAAFEEHGGSPETNPFNSPVVCLYLMEVKECQRKARGLNNG